MRVSRLILGIAASICSIQAAPTTVVLTASPSPATFWGFVTLTATVTPAEATGKVTFYDGVAVLGVAQISSGSAVLGTYSLGPGTRSLKAYYAGDGTYSPSTSTPVSEVVNSLPGSHSRR
jgi:hypothetical protein